MLNIQRNFKFISTKCLVAFCCLILLCFVMVGLAQLLQHLQQTSFEKPYFTCWVTQSSYVIFLLFIPVLRCIRHTYFAHQPEVDEVRSVTLTDQRMLVRIIFFTVLAFSSRYSWYLSLPRTAVSINFILYNSSCIFVYGLSVILLHEAVSISKLVSVIMCVIGMIIVTLFSVGSKSGEERNTIFGYSALIFSTVCYALYTTLYKVYFDQRNTTNARCASEMETFVSGETINSLDEAAVSADEEAVDNGDGDECSMSTSCTNWSSRTHSIILSLEQSCVLLGGMGTFTLLFMGFGMAPLDFFSIEKFSWPSASTWFYLFVSASLDGSSNILLLFGILLSSPLFMTVGLILTIPVAVFSDMILHAYFISAIPFIGTLVIIGGFLGLNVSMARVQP